MYFLEGSLVDDDGDFPLEKRDRDDGKPMRWIGGARGEYVFEQTSGTSFINPTARGSATELQIKKQSKNQIKQAGTKRRKG